MTTEQKEAIEYLKEHINYFKEQIRFIEAVDCDYYDEEYELYKNRVKQFETVLNLIQEKEKEIEKYKKLYQKALDDAIVTAHDNMQKDKIIDELAKAFKQDDVRSVEEIKEYFEELAKEEGE